ncbi:hypothetical protein F442_15153 [Phytophthora nicotianae P10297]|uniref:Uncharacterized protein n=3 Tax=Phytophthora nicotianae TaxID=4792 RepID=W2YQS8_PHYNI|nr:hypothetical protein L914_14713 [Phytophthora nicotianae]ETO67801.1 hypothetical protein F444_15309 [Phytophthora nicotianae P1976]ETP37003.1 hypothetical protein F442_15153 [Phytophthora nicotianae P10297]
MASASHTTVTGVRHLSTQRVLIRHREPTRALFARFQCTPPAEQKQSIYYAATTLLLW